MPSFYVVSYNHQSHPIDPGLIESELSKLKDWISFSPNTWFVWTSLQGSGVHMLLEPLRTHKQYHIVARLDPTDWYGWMSTTTIDWLKKERDESMPGY